LPRLTAKHLRDVVGRMRVPVVHPSATFFFGDPAYGGRFSTYNPTRDCHYLRADIGDYEIRHEYGHVFDYKVLRSEHRELLLRWWGIPDRFWFWDGVHDPMRPGPEAGCEIFANVYARAATSRFRYYRFKKLIRIAYREAGL